MFTPHSLSTFRCLPARFGDHLLETGALSEVVLHAQYSHSYLPGNISQRIQRNHDGEKKEKAGQKRQGRGEDAEMKGRPSQSVF